MKLRNLQSGLGRAFIGPVVLAIAVVGSPEVIVAQKKSAAADHDLAAQVRDLQSKIVKLEAALKQDHKAMPSSPPDAGKGAGMPMGAMRGPKTGQGTTSMGGMEGMDIAEMMQMMGRMMQMMGSTMKGMGGVQGKGMGGMGMMEDDMMMGGMSGQKQVMAGMSGMMDMDMMKGGMKMMEDDMEMMGMMGNGSMTGMGAKGMKMKMASALPGFPGGSHIYHIGATGFFLDHPEHITLTTEQQTKLNKAKQKALLDKANAQREIDEAEQELWELTGADEPDSQQIEAKVTDIEKLRSEQRLAFIRSVGEAAKVLTDDQRKILLGQEKPDVHKAHPPATK